MCLYHVITVDTYLDYNGVIKLKKLFSTFVSITNVFYIVVSMRIIKMVYMNSQS